MEDKIEVANKMSQYNSSIQRCLKTLKQKRMDLEALIHHEEKERAALQDDVEKITYKLAALNKILLQRILMKENYENSIREIEANYKRIIELSETLSIAAEQQTTELMQDIVKKTPSRTQSPDKLQANIALMDDLISSTGKPDSSSWERDTRVEIAPLRELKNRTSKGSLTIRSDTLLAPAIKESFLDTTVVSSDSYKSSMSVSTSASPQPNSQPNTSTRQSKPSRRKTNLVTMNVIPSPDSDKKCW